MIHCISLFLSGRWVRVALSAVKCLLLNAANNQVTNEAGTNGLMMRQEKTEGTAPGCVLKALFTLPHNLLLRYSLRQQTGEEYLYSLSEKHQ